MAAEKQRKQTHRRRAAGAFCLLRDGRLRRVHRAPELRVCPLSRLAAHLHAQWESQASVAATGGVKGCI